MVKKEYDEEGPGLGKLDFELTLDFDISQIQLNPDQYNAVGIYYTDPSSTEPEFDVLPFEVDGYNNMAHVKGILTYADDKQVKWVHIVLNQELPGGTPEISCMVEAVNEDVGPGSYVTLSRAVVNNVSQITGTQPKSFFDYDRDDEYAMMGVQAYYFGRRYYDPEIGVWGAVDPAGQYFNGYLYCSNNPILVVDPDGNFSWIPAIVGAAMGAIQGGIIADQNGGNVGLGILGGAAIGFGSGALGSWVGDFSKNAMLSAMMSSTAASTANSIGMYALSGGKTDISTSYGPFSMNWSKGKFNVASPTNPMGMLAWFSFMQDINAGLIPYGPQAPGKGPGEGIELNKRKLDYAGGGATDPNVPIRYVEDIPAAVGHDPGYVAQGVTIRDNVGTVRALGFDRRVIDADFALARSELAIRNSVLGYLDPISRSNAGLIAAFGIATGTVKSLGYASWFQW